MDPRLFREAKEILLEALALPPERRNEYVHSRCAERPDLAAEVLSLLCREDSVSPVVSGGVVKFSGGMPERIGPYEIVEVLGEGGMGVVYRGRQTVPIEREVAVKVLHAGLDTERILDRFAWERRSLARMNHPNIARILDAGSDGGRPYVVLELIEGTPITTWCREHGGDVERRLQMLEKVCQAVQHAHDRGVLHRDLKPGNVLVREVDGEPAPCVIDFGIAKALDDTAGGGVELTLEGQRIGTPAYMSPEQLAGAVEDVDVRTDVYALGMILYELMAGRRPFDDAHLSRSPSRDEPPAPSRAAGRRELRGDLDNICLKAIRPEKERRYGSATALADDLRRHREGRPVEASPDSWRYRLGKTARRNPAQVTLVLALFVFTTAGVASLAYHARRLDAERDRALVAETHARQEAAAAEEIASFLENLFVELDPIEEGRTATSALELLDKGAARLTEVLGDQPANRGRLWGVMGRVNQNIARHELAEQQLRAGLAAYAEAADTNATVAARSELSYMLAICLHDLSRHAESEAAFRHTVALHRRAYPELNVTQVQMVTDLATAIQAQGRQEEALKMLREAIELAEDLGEEGAPEVAYIRNIRGYILYQLGRYQEALDDMSTALEVQRDLIRGDSLDLVSSLNNVGGMSLELGRLNAAEGLIVESKEMLERIYQGEGHPAISRAILHLGRIALARGDTATAVARLEDSHALMLEQMGSDHPSTWSAAQGLAMARTCQGRLTEARRLYEECLGSWLGSRGPTYFKTLISRHEYGQFLHLTGNQDAARREFESLIAAYEGLGQLHHPRRLETRVDLAEILMDEGDHAGAARQLAGALPELVHIYGPDAPVCVRARELKQRGGL